MYRYLYFEIRTQIIVENKFPILPDKINLFVHNNMYNLIKYKNVNIKKYLHGFIYLYLVLLKIDNH